MGDSRRDLFLASRKGPGCTGTDAGPRAGGGLPACGQFLPFLNEGPLLSTASSCSGALTKSVLFWPWSSLQCCATVELRRAVEQRGRNWREKLAGERMTALRHKRTKFRRLELEMLAACLSYRCLSRALHLGCTYSSLLRCVRDITFRETFPLHNSSAIACRFCMWHVRSR